MSLADYLHNGAQAISNGFVNYGPTIYNAGTLLLATGTGASVLFLGGMIANANASDTILSKIIKLVSALGLGVLTSTAILMITHPYTPVNMLLTKSIVPVIGGVIAITPIAIAVGGAVFFIGILSLCAKQNLFKNWF